MSYTTMGGLDAVKLDRWITREPDWDDDPDEKTCVDCGAEYDGERMWPGGWLCPACAAKIAAAEREVERMIDAAETALDEYTEVDAEVEA